MQSISPVSLDRTCRVNYRLQTRAFAPTCRANRSAMSMSRRKTLRHQAGKDRLRHSRDENHTLDRPQHSEKNRPQTLLAISGKWGRFSKNMRHEPSLSHAERKRISCCQRAYRHRNACHRQGVYAKLPNLHIFYKGKNIRI